MGCRWRLASGRRKVVKWGPCWPDPRGACGAGGAPAPGSGATTPFPEAGVRKHPAPEGALRHGLGLRNSPVVHVRKHPAPEGALRLKTLTERLNPWAGQKAPSTTRCIKTGIAIAAPATVGQKAPSTTRCIKTGQPPDQSPRSPVRKPPAPLGALRHLHQSPSVVVRQLESTWHQKCIKTRQNCR